ncbi:MAG: AAA family ATPase [Bacteroidota bacterium]
MTNYPKGAQALLIAMQTPAPKGYLGIPTLIWGRPGVGKSSFLEALERPDFPVLTLIASIHDPTDFSGLPVFQEGKVQYAVPEWVNLFQEREDGLLLLDELTTAPPAVQAALLRVVLERKVGFHELPQKVRIVAAANPTDFMTGGWDLSPPLRNRFVHIEWDLPTGTYLQALEEGFPEATLPQIDAKIHAELVEQWKLRIAAFLKLSPDLLYTMPDSDPLAFASPRSWEFAAALLAACDYLGLAPTNEKGGDPVSAALVRGCIGQGPTLPFFEFLTNLNLPDPTAVLEGRDKVHLHQLNDSEVYVFFNALNGQLQQAFESEDFYKMAIVYFELVQEVFDDGRRDLIYVALKRISKAGLLLKALSSATKARASKEVLFYINKLFQDEGLKEFIDVFER